MRVTTVRDFGALVRTARRAQGMTQADLAERVGVSREWVVRLEAGHPRVEVQKVLDTLVVLGLVLDVEQQPLAAETTARSQAARKVPADEVATAKAATAKASRKPRKAASVMPRTTDGTHKPAAKKAARSPRAVNKAVADPFDSLFARRTDRRR
jgi:y4mF family transcriptional regulator